MEKYIVITTLSDDLEVITIIKNKLLINHLVSSCQINEVISTYWWNNDIVEAKEYCLKMRTKESLYEKVASMIKEFHNYDIPEISYYEINGSQEITKWIDYYTENKGEE